MTLQGLFENYKSFVKKCIRCGHFYRYQESCHGMRNYDDRLFLDINVCLYLRKHLLNHNSISSFVDLYNSMFNTNILHQRVLCSYLTFDVLSSVETEYFCNICGHHPWALVMDLNKKNLLEVSCEWNSCDETEDEETVDVEEFWESVEYDMLARIFQNCVVQ